MFEAEVLPLFLGGVFLVILIELIFSIIVLRKYPEVKRPMIGHVVCLLIAFVCLGVIFFGNGTLPDGGVMNQSGRFALFGIFWFIGECLGIVAVKNALSAGKKQKANKSQSGSVKIKKL